jgi:hypothetical protein
MRQAILVAGAAAALSVAGLSAASAQVVVAEPGYVGPAYVSEPAYPVYADPGYGYAYEPGYGYNSDYVVAPAAPIGGYVQPRYSYSVNGPVYRHGYYTTNYYANRGVCEWNNGSRYCY